MKINQIAQVLATLGMASWAVTGMAQQAQDVSPTLTAQQARAQGAGVQQVVEKVLMTHPEVQVRISANVTDHFGAS